MLASSRPNAFRPGLANSLNNLSNRLSDVGRREEALSTAKEALGALTPSFMAQPDAFRERMGIMVGNYRALLGQVGRDADLDPILRMLESSG